MLQSLIQTLVLGRLAHFVLHNDFMTKHRILLCMTRYIIHSKIYKVERSPLHFQVSFTADVGHFLLKMCYSELPICWRVPAAAGLVSTALRSSR